MLHERWSILKRPELENGLELKSNEFAESNNSDLWEAAP